MQPKKFSFTMRESEELGVYLDRFVAAGPLEALSEEEFRDVQVLIARKIWELRPDIARAIQAVADHDQPPALLIENVPVDPSLPDTPKYIRLSSASSLPPLRSHYFHAGVALIRYGNIVPLGSLHLLNVVNEPDDIKHGKVHGRRMHRDIYNTNLGDIALHVQRENQQAATPLISIDEIPAELSTRLKKANFTHNGNAAHVIQAHGKGWRFHPRFKCADDVYSVDDAQSVRDFFDWMQAKSQESPLVLRNGDFLLIDQSRIFHSGNAHEVIKPRERDRWLTHARFEVLDGSEKSPGFYKLPGDIDEGAILSRLIAGKSGRSAPATLV